MARAAWISLTLLVGLGAAGLRADYAQEEAARQRRQADEAVWQTVFGQRVVDAARKQLGRPYVWGGKDPQTGFDCSGLVAWVFGSLGVDAGGTALQQYQRGVEIMPGGLIPGDLVFFLGRGSPLHVGIYLGQRRFLHAPGEGKQIEVSSLDSRYFSLRFIGARRFTPPLDEERRRRGREPQASRSILTNPSEENRP